MDLCALQSAINGAANVYDLLPIASAIMRNAADLNISDRLVQHLLLLVPASFAFVCHFDKWHPYDLFDQPNPLLPASVMRRVLPSVFKLIRLSRFFTTDEQLHVAAVVTNVSCVKTIPPSIVCDNFTMFDSFVIAANPACDFATATKHKLTSNNTMLNFALGSAFFDGLVKKWPADKQRAFASTPNCSKAQAIKLGLWPTGYYKYKVAANTIGRCWRDFRMRRMLALCFESAPAYNYAQGHFAKLQRLQAELAQVTDSDSLCILSVGIKF